MYANVGKHFAIIGCAMLLAFPFLASAASIRLVPASAAVREGELIPVSVVVASSDQAMNAASGVIKFASDILQVVSVSKSASVIGVWVQEPSFSNSAGTVNFEGIALNPGYQGSSGTILTITFRAREKGTAALSFAEASVLANDGNGTEILTDTKGGTISVAEAPPPAPVKSAPVITTPMQMQPEQEKPADLPVAAPVLQQKSTIEHGYDPSRAWAWLTRGAITPAVTLLVLLIIAFAVIDVLLLLLYLRKRDEKGGELEHAQNLTHRSFLLLRDDVDSFVKELEAESANRTLSATEERFVKTMRGDLSDSEKAIVRELRAAEKKIK